MFTTKLRPAPGAGVRVDAQSRYFDGFVGVRRPFFDNTSIFGRHAARRSRRGSPGCGSFMARSTGFSPTTGEVIRTPQAEGRSPADPPVASQVRGESADAPYLALLDRLRGYLAQRGALLVTCGYSYRDNHINAVLGEALDGNATGSLIALMRSKLETYPEATALAARHPNMALLARDSAVIGTREGPWTVRGGNHSLRACKHPATTASEHRGQRSANSAVRRAADGLLARPLPEPDDS